LAYSHLWESLTEALRRIVLNGIGETTAKDQLSQAIADGQVKVQVLIDRSDPEVGGQVLAGSSLSVPERLSSEDLDWERSCPFGPWETGPGNVEHYEATWRWQARPVQRLEVSTIDVNVIWDASKVPPISGPSGGSTVADGRRLERWLTDRMSGNPDAPMSKADTKEAAESAGLRFSDRAFHRAWSNAIQASGATQWSKAGRKPKS
jgi:hypothetical protein